MTGKQIQAKLEDMKGATFEYAKAQHTVKSYVIDASSETFEIKTSLSSFKRKFDSAPDFFKHWFETKENALVNEATKKISGSDIIPVYEKETNLTNDLVDILMNNINQVKRNPAFIPQAKAINNDVNSIIHIQRLKLEMVKHLKKNKD